MADENKKPKKKIGKKGKIAICFATAGAILAGGIAVVKGVTGYVPKTEVPVATALYDDESCLSDLVASEYAGELAEIEKIEKDNALRVQLDDLDLEDYEPVTVDVSALTQTDVELSISQFNESKDSVDLKTPNATTEKFNKVVNQLSSYEKYLQENANVESIEYINNFAELLICSVTLDALGWGADRISNVSTNLTKLDEDFVITFVSEDGKEYELKLAMFTNLKTVVNSVRKLNEMAAEYGKADSDVTVKSYQKQQDRTLDSFIYVINSEFECENGKIKTLTK